MPTQKKDPYADQAQAASVVRYGPELSALTALLRAAETSYADRVRNAKSARQFTVGAVDQAVPQVDQAYQGAQAAVQPAFAQGGGVEAQALQARLGESAALAQSQLAGRRVGAVEGQGAAQQQALRDFREDRGKIGDRSTDLAREIGAFQTQTAGELGAAESAALAQQQELVARLGQSERNSVRSSGVDPDTGLPIPGGKLDPSKKSGAGRDWVTPQQQAAAGDDISGLQGFAAQLKAAAVNRKDAAAALVAGQEPQPVYRTVKLPNGGTKQEKVLNADGTPKTTPAVPKAKSQLLLSAALDMVYDGHLSRRNQQLLHARGIKLKPLGLVTYAEWSKKMRSDLAQGGLAPGQRPH